MSTSSQLSQSTMWTLPNAGVSVRQRAPIVVHEWKVDPEADAAGKNSFVRDLHLKELLAYTMLFGLLYSICYLVPYGMTDAYTKLYESVHSTLPYNELTTIAGGRPLLALLTELSLSPFRSYEDLRYLAVVSILGIVLLAWALYQMLLFAGLGKYPASIIPALMCLAPAFQVYAAWAVCAYYPYAAVLAGTALITVEQAHRAPSLPAKFALSAVGSLVFLSALLIYQPAAMMYWVFAAIVLLTGRADVRATWARFPHYALVAGVGLACGQVVVHLASVLVGGASPAVAQSAPLADALGKPQWLLGDVMYNALNLYNVTPTMGVALVVASGVVVGMLAFVEGSWMTRASRLAIAAILLPLAYLPNLIAPGNGTSYRTQVALTSLIILYLAFGFVSLRKIRLPVVTLAAYAGLLALAIVGGFTAARNVALDFAVPQYEELALMRSQLSSPKLNSATSVYLIPATRQDAFAPVVRYDEFGVVSSSVAWSEKPMVYFVLRDINPRHDEIPVTVAPATGPFNPPPGSLVVDMRPVKTLAPYPPEFG